MDTVRVGLIGAGRIGQVHARSVASHPDTQLVSIADVFLDGAQALAREHGVEATANPDELFDSNTIDALIIASPTATHVDLIEQAVDAGIPALCEKPIDLDIARVDAIREKVAASSTPIAIGFNRRFDPHFANLHAKCPHIPPINDGADAHLISEWLLAGVLRAPELLACRRGTTEQAKKDETLFHIRLNALK